MNKNLELKLQAWVDEELSPAEARSVEEQIAADAEAQRLMSELKWMACVMAGSEEVRAVPETREFYWSKIQREIERQSRGAQTVQAPRRAAWRSWISPFLGFASLACMLVLAVGPFAPPTFDEISSTGEGMEAVTFHDQSAGMTVVWLADTTQQSDVAQPVETPAPKAATPDSDNSETEME